MRTPVSVVRGLAAVLIALVVLAGCSLQLVPQHDPSIVDGLNTTNTKTLTLFSALANGSPKAKFADYKARYDEVIGAFDALRLKAEARPVPQIGQTIASLGPLRDICGTGSGTNACINSSPASMETIVMILSGLRDLHLQSGLPADDVAISKQMYVTSVAQALKVETALKR
jgi:hypothetical protein